MNYLPCSFGLLLLGALLSLLLSGHARLAKAASLGLLGAGCVVGLIPALVVLGGGAIAELHAPWPVPLGEFSIGVDPLSAFFLLLIYPVCLAGGVFGEGYLEASKGRPSPAYVRFFYFLITASMAVLVCARNAVLFLAAWEVMALSSFFLVCAEDEKAEVRRAGLLYLVCTHTGTLSLFVLFVIMGSAAGSMDFELMGRSLSGGGANLTGLFALALVGFGIKAGVMPLHIWLQEAHPAAPSHVSAVLSGVVIKTGIYGFMRFLSLCPSVPQSWGFVFLAIGASSGVLGVVFALAQHDLKRLLAYHSIENIGIIALGMGLGCLGLSGGNAPLAVIGFASASLHVLNHGLFKSLLFLGAGAFYRALGTRDIERAGGLLKRMPRTSLFSWIGAAAICGLPPFNGFISEWLLYYGFLGGGLTGGARYAVFSSGALALIGGLAAACFTKAYGALTLGEPRTPTAQEARDPGGLMLWPMGLLASACLGIGLFPGPFVRSAARCAATIGRLAPEAVLPALDRAMPPLSLIGGLGIWVLGLSGLFWLWRGNLLAGRETASGPTWGCGFAQPTPRMQYTASSYAQPLARVFGGILRSEEAFHPPAGYWPKQASFHSRTPDPALDRILFPALSTVEKGLTMVRRLQHGRLQYYLLYVLVFLITILLWKL